MNQQLDSESDVRIRSAALRDETDALVTRQTAARILSVNEKTIDRWAKDGDFKTYRYRGEVRYLKSELVGVWKAM